MPVRTGSNLIGPRESRAGAVSFPARVEVVDSHTEGEPTRVVVEGWPQPEGRTMAERRAFLLARQDHLRQAGGDGRVGCEGAGSLASDTPIRLWHLPPLAQGKG